VEKYHSFSAFTLKVGWRGHLEYKIIWKTCGRTY